MCSSLAGRSKTVRPFAPDACVASDDAAGRDISYRDLLSVRTHDVLEYSIAVEEGISEMIADNHAVVADASELCVAVHHLSVIQRSKGAIAIDEPMIGSATIAGIHIYADNHAIIVEGSRQGLDRAGKIGHREK